MHETIGGFYNQNFEICVNEISISFLAILQRVIFLLTIFNIGHHFDPIHVVLKCFTKEDYFRTSDTFCQTTQYKLYRVQLLTHKSKYAFLSPLSEKNFTKHPLHLSLCLPPRMNRAAKEFVFSVVIITMMITMMITARV